MTPTPPSPDLAPDVGVSHKISLENDISTQATIFLGFFDCIHDSRLSFSHRTDAGSGVIESEVWSIAFRGAGAARCSRFVKDGPPVAERGRRIGRDLPPAPRRPVRGRCRRRALVFPRAAGAAASSPLTLRNVHPSLPPSSPSSPPASPRLVIVARIVHVAAIALAVNAVVMRGVVAGPRTPARRRHRPPRPRPRPRPARRRPRHPPSLPVLPPSRPVSRPRPRTSREDSRAAPPSAGARPSAPYRGPA